MADEFTEYLGHSLCPWSNKMTFQNLLRDPVLVILAVASLVSWALIVHGAAVIRKAAREDHYILPADEKATDTPLARLWSELKRNQGSDRDHLLTVMDTSIALERHRLDRNLPLLGVIGSTAPYMGLLGTVIGIIQAFQSIQAQNNMSPSVVAGGISTALIATAMGLAVAIPAVAAHHLLAAAVNRRVSEWEAVVAEWLPKTNSIGGPNEPVSRA
jgi:biopolymer transport protein ExbB/TolQ